MKTKRKRVNGQAAKSNRRVAIVVRRGALRRFDALKTKTADLPVELSWDRRLTNRRAASDVRDTDRRKTDRRAAPPATWELADFVVLPASTDTDND